MPLMAPHSRSSWQAKAPGSPQLSLCTKQQLQKGQERRKMRRYDGDIMGIWFDMMEICEAPLDFPGLIMT